jgi:hypothetical protein
LKNIPRVSSEEMADIENLYGKKPPKKITVARREIIDG